MFGIEQRLLPLTPQISAVVGIDNARVFTSWQYVFRLGTEHDFFRLRAEHWQQADFALLSSKRAEWKPNAVGRAEVGFTVVFCELLSGKHKFPLRLPLWRLHV